MVDRDAEFTAYVVQRRPQLYRLAFLLCSDAHRAEDIVQTALAKLYTAWDRASRLDGIDAYVRRIVVNSHLDDTRRPWRRERVRETEHLDGPAVTPLGVEETDALWSALRALPEGQRRVVVLRHYWGLSVEETARDLGISTGTVKSQSSLAVHQLRRVLDPAPSTGYRR
ncbi:SigE family RNA polymerase sigma factor [Nocardioides sp. S5]|uniref:SigE family RNA polymerase sigma factor n=1 Tax=Nocardioides sp. S5 TaxID=2017486 RepID=UPI001A8D5D34|nr:SigE family RNA polymerase sigma factor [Nocardioides sp. S5]QSR32619.1 SigE family RNA polymerase sigma factor [Nocardioides sp. S5]